MSIVRPALLWSVAMIVVPVSGAHAEPHDRGVFVQGGYGERQTSSVTVGYVHAFRPIEAERASHWSFHGEASLGRWFARGGEDRRQFTQIGLTPVARYSFTRGASGWYVEAGVGLNVITPKFRSGDRRFSTPFNFGDHAAVGTRFGDGSANEVALRVQHFSNGGIKEPNPGEDFVQLRYVRHF